MYTIAHIISTVSIEGISWLIKVLIIMMDGGNLKLNSPLLISFLRT